LFYCQNKIGVILFLINIWKWKFVVLISSKSISNPGDHLIPFAMFLSPEHKHRHEPISKTFFNRLNQINTNSKKLPWNTQNALVAKRVEILDSSEREICKNLLKMQLSNWAKERSATSSNQTAASTLSSDWSDIYIKCHL